MKLFTKSILTASTIITSAAFIGCSDDIAKSSNEDVKAEGNVTIVVSDKSTGSFLDSVAVVLLNTKEDTVYTTSGAVIYPNLLAGSYKLKVIKTGYASKTVDAVVAFGANGNTPIAYTPTFSVELPKLGANVSGLLTETLSGSTKGFISNQTITLNFTNDELITREYSVVTDANGVYNFANLPANEEYAINFPARKTGTVVKTAASKSSLTTPAAGSITYVSTANYTLAGLPLDLMSETDDSKDLATTAKISYTFSQPIDITKFDLTAITARQDDDVEVTSAWSNGNKTLTISPKSGAWAEGESIRLTFDESSLVSTAGKVFAGNVDKTFSVLAAP